jgi:hypothetical protein
MSVGAFDAFFGQLAQIMPAGSISSRSRPSFSSRSARSVTKICAQWIPGVGTASSDSTMPDNAISWRTLSGIPSNHTRRPSLRLSFFASGVPE